MKILESIEKYSKTDINYLLKGGSWLTLGQIVSTFSAFIISVVFANLIPSETFGTYKYVLSITSLLAITTLSGMDSAMTQSVARGFDGILLIGIKEKIKWGLFGSIISIIFSVYYFLNGNTTLFICFLIVSVFMPIVEGSDLFNSLLWGKKLFDVQTKYSITKKIFSLLIIVAVVYKTNNLYLILLAYFATSLLPNIYFLFESKKYLENDLVDSELIKYGKKLSGVYVVSLLLTELDKILVFHFLGATKLAIYSLATAPTDQIKGLLKNVNSLAMPKFSQKNISEIKRALPRKILLLFVTITIMVVCYITLSPLLFKIFFPKYLLSVKYSQILSISLIPVVISGFLYTILESQKAEKEIYKYNIYSNLFGIIILFPLIQHYGISGAILSRVITRFFSFGLIAEIIKKTK